MGRRHSDDSLRKSQRTPVNKETFPQIEFDPFLDFGSIKLAPGIEARSFLKDGMVFLEDRDGHIIEIQFINLSQAWAKLISHKPTPSKSKPRSRPRTPQRRKSA